jgi:hypothetical protein
MYAFVCACDSPNAPDIEERSAEMNALADEGVLDKSAQREMAKEKACSQPSSSRIFSDPIFFQCWFSRLFRLDERKARIDKENCPAEEFLPILSLFVSLREKSSWWISFFLASLPLWSPDKIHPIERHQEKQCLYLFLISDSFSGAFDRIDWCGNVIGWFWG